MSVEIAAPAKLNLGLDVIGRRDDGYHEIATIYLTIDLQDRLRLSPSEKLEVQCSHANLACSDNLALQALQQLRKLTGSAQGAHIELSKRIPIASGLGGASSDAAAALLAGREMWRLPVSDAALHSVAARLGSDVPFFLTGGCAVGRGRGEILKRLPVPRDLWFAIVVPRISIPRKTATLYSALTRNDFGDEAQVTAQARRLAAGLPIDPALLRNAFTRPLYELAPRLAELPALMRDAGAGVVALSGAGPSHYVPFMDGAEAEAVAHRLRVELGESAHVIVARPAPEGPARPLPL